MEYIDTGIEIKEYSEKEIAEMELGVTRTLNIVGITDDGVRCILCENKETGERGYYNPQTKEFKALTRQN